MRLCLNVILSRKAKNLVFVTDSKYEMLRFAHQHDT
jgi:hypothetical protein